MKSPFISDGRNQFGRFTLADQGFEYYPIGIPGATLPNSNKG
jgi:hypothetical protein